MTLPPCLQSGAHSNTVEPEQSRVLTEISDYRRHRLHLESCVEEKKQKRQLHYAFE